MRILMVNKFLYPNGGSETYVFELGAYLKRIGHDVQYFGMEHPKRCVGNAVNAYTATMDFHAAKGMAKIGYALKTIYSTEARKKLRLVLDDFKPEVVHLNNFNYQLTPSMIVEIVKWKRETGNPCRVVFTAHDFQLICPNHQLFNPGQGKVCEKCVGGHFLNCVKGKCIHDSTLRSVLGFCEASYWNGRNIYRHLDAVICPSQFMKRKMDTNPALALKTVFLRNFTGRKGDKPVDASVLQDLPPRYVLYFGRFSTEKGIATLLSAAEALKDIPFVFAGNGPLKARVDAVSNIRNMGFLSGGALNGVISGAAFSVIPSEWYENCPYSIIESMMLGTPVLGATIGGIPELIRNGQDGELFESGNVEDLKARIQSLWRDEARIKRYRESCAETGFDTVVEYAQKLMPIYGQSL